MSYAAYIPSVCCLLPQHTLPLDWARRYVNPMIHAWCYSTWANTLAVWFRVHHTWTKILSHYALLEYVPQIGMGKSVWTQLGIQNGWSPDSYLESPSTHLYIYKTIYQTYIYFKKYSSLVVHL